jgi:hypothetical protein
LLGDVLPAHGDLHLQHDKEALMSSEGEAFNEVRYNASTVGCTMFVGLYKAFEQELGQERALPVLRKYGETLVDPP